MSRALKLYAPRTVALLVAAAFAGHTYANTGRVEFVFGGATLRNAQGDRPLTRGVDLRTGDAVITTDGRVQVRFSDGAFVSLQPNTEFKIDDYRFDGQTDGSERGIFGLVKGAMRTVTGLVGRTNRSNYQVRTPTATVGIRGTGGLISVLADLSTLVRGTSGVWTLANLSGVTFEVPAGRAGIAGPNQNQPPRETAQGPTAPPAPPTEQVAQVPITPAENRNPTGGSTAFLADKAIGAVIADVFDAIDIFVVRDGSFTNDPNISVKGTIGSSNELTGFTFRNLASGESAVYRFAGTLNEPGSSTDGAVSWGRWTGPVTLTVTSGGHSETFSEAYSPNQGLHYAIGVPTAPMPTTGSWAYSLIGATAPTVQNGMWAPGTVNPALSYFNGYFTPTGGNFNTGIYYNIGPGSWQLFASGSINGSSFSGSGSNYGPCDSPCAGSFPAQVVGGFAGAGALYSGVAYKGQVDLSGNHVGGAAVFKQSGLAPF